jgi:hypothetical protein
MLGCKVVNLTLNRKRAPLSLMFRRSCFVFIFVTSFLMSQQPAMPAAEASAKAPTAADVPMDAPVIVISNAYMPGYCEPGEKDPKTGKSKTPTDCVITRAAFERLFDAVPKPGGEMKAADAPASMRRSIATTYASMIGWSKDATRRGLENSPRVQEQLRLARVQILERAMKETLQKENANPAEALIAAYYKDNLKSYQELNLERVLIPQIADPDPANPSAERAKVSADDANKYQARAVAGEGMEALQQEIWKKLNKKGDAPRVNATRRHNTMRPEQEAVVFPLKEGEVSVVLPEGVNFVFYKVKSRKTLGLDEVKEEIRRSLAAQATQDAEARLNEEHQPKLGEVYFQTAGPHHEEPPVTLPAPAPAK